MRPAAWLTARMHWQAGLLASWAHGSTALSQPLTRPQLALLWARVDKVVASCRDTGTFVWKHCVFSPHAHACPRVCAPCRRGRARRAASAGAAAAPPAPAQDKHGVLGKVEGQELLRQALTVQVCRAAVCR